jgi:hypothetical protein
MRFSERSSVRHCTTDKLDWAAFHNRTTTSYRALALPVGFYELSPAGKYWQANFITAYYRNRTPLGKPTSFANARLTAQQHHNLACAN